MHFIVVLCFSCHLHVDLCWSQSSIHTTVIHGPSVHNNTLVFFNLGAVSGFRPGRAITLLNMVQPWLAVRDHLAA